MARRKNSCAPFCVILKKVNIFLQKKYLKKQIISLYIKMFRNQGGYMKCGGKKEEKKC